MAITRGRARMSWPCSTIVGTTPRTRASTPITPNGCARLIRCCWDVFHTRGFKGFWPSVADDPDATPIQREISHLNNAIDKVVISDSLTPEEAAPWHNTRIIGRVAAHEQIAELRGCADRRVANVSTSDEEPI